MANLFAAIILAGESVFTLLIQAHF